MSDTGSHEQPFDITMPGTSRPAVFLRRDLTGSQAKDLSDLSKLSKKQLEEQLRAKQQMLARKDMMDKLPDKGLKIQQKVEEIQRVLRELEAKEQTLEEVFDRAMRIDAASPGRKEPGGPRVVMINGNPLRIEEDKKIQIVELEEVVEIEEAAHRDFMVSSL